MPGAHGRVLSPPHPGRTMTNAPRTPYDDGAHLGRRAPEGIQVRLLDSFFVLGRLSRTPTRFVVEPGQVRPTHVTEHVGQVLALLQPTGGPLQKAAVLVEFTTEGRFDPHATNQDTGQVVGAWRAKYVSAEAKLVVGDAASELYGTTPVQDVPAGGPWPEGWYLKDDLIQHRLFYPVRITADTGGPAVTVQAYEIPLRDEFDGVHDPGPHAVVAMRVPSLGTLPMAIGTSVVIG